MTSSELRKYIEKQKEKRRKTDRAWREKNREKLREYTLKSRARHPEKHAARILVSVAIKSKKLVLKPCKICGNNKVEAHHVDYLKPLEVVWLCKEHHIEADKKLRKKTLKNKINI